MFGYFFFYLYLRFLENMHFTKGKSLFSRFSLKVCFYNFCVFFLQKIVQKPIENWVPAPKKSMPKTCFLLTSIVSRSSLDFEGSSASKLAPNWLSWAPRTLPKAFKIQFFGHMCPRCFPRGSKVAPKGSQGGPRGRFSEHFRWIWEPFFVILGCENWLYQPSLQTSYVLAEWRHHLKGTYLQTSSHMSKEGRRYVRSTRN